MATGRNKTAAYSGSSSSSSSGHHRSSYFAPSAHSAVWQWQDDSDEGIYHDFEDAVRRQLEAAYVSGKKQFVEVSTSGRRPKCVVDIRSMLMTVKASKKSSSQLDRRLVLRLIYDDGSYGSSNGGGWSVGQPCWQWKCDQCGDLDAWVMYSSDCTAALEAAWQSRHRVPVRLDAIDPELTYVVDVVTRRQTNIYTSYSRDVRRLILQSGTLLQPQPPPQPPLQRPGAGTASFLRPVSTAQPVSTPVSKRHGQTSMMTSLTGSVNMGSFVAGVSPPSNFARATHNIVTEVTTNDESVGGTSGSIDQFVEAVLTQDSLEVCPICLDELHVPSSPAGATGSSKTVAGKSVTSSKDVASMHYRNSTGGLWSSSPGDVAGFRSASQWAATPADPGSSWAAAEGSASSAVVRLVSCKHQLHRLCLNDLMDQSASAKQGAASSIKCPTCGRLYGVETGTCPRGKMTSQLLSSTSLRGFENCGAIQITYDIMSGIQGPEHPHPGRRFSAVGFPRVAYLPDNTKGRLVLRMLQVAFKRRLTFTVGSSVTTGQTDVVTWNEIHHKTSTEGPYGYPDAGYLDRVICEMEAFGIMASDYSV